MFTKFNTKLHLQLSEESAQIISPLCPEVPGQGPQDQHLKAESTPYHASSYFKTIAEEQDQVMA